MAEESMRASRGFWVTGCVGAGGVVQAKSLPIIPTLCAAPPASVKVLGMLATTRLKSN